MEKAVRYPVERRDEEAIFVSDEQNHQGGEGRHVTVRYSTCHEDRAA